MVKMGSLNDYRKAQNVLDNAGIGYTKEEGEFIRKLIGDDGTELLSIARLNGKTWVFRYNEQIFSS